MKIWGSLVIVFVVWVFFIVRAIMDPSVWEYWVAAAGFGLAFIDLTVRSRTKSDEFFPWKRGQIYL